MELKKGVIYSFHDLEKYFGDDRSYSFQKNGAVTALILNGEMNPTFLLEKFPSSAEVLVAKGQIRESIAKGLNTFKPYPTFVKVKTNQWRYVGEYMYHDYLTDTDTIQESSKKAKRKLDEIAGVIFLKSKAAEKAVIKKKAA